MYSKILLATDLSGVSTQLVDHLPHLIRVGLQEVLIVHVVNLRDAGDFAEELQTHDQQMLEDYKNRLEQQGIRVTVKVPIGVPSHEISKLAEEENVSLILIGSHGRSLIKEIVLGSVGEQVIRDARKPVLIMKLSPDALQGCQLYCDNIFHSILYPTDFSKDAEKVLPYIKQGINGGNEKIVLLHVQEEQRINPHLADRLEEFNQIDQDRLDRIKQELLDAGAKNVITRIESGKAVPTILQVAVGEGCCLIALGARGRSLFGEIFVGSTANNVARYAKCPVLFVA